MCTTECLCHCIVCDMTACSFLLHFVLDFACILYSFSYLVIVGVFVTSGPILFMSYLFLSSLDLEVFFFFLCLILTYLCIYIASLLLFIYNISSLFLVYAPTPSSLILVLFCYLVTCLTQNLPGRLFFVTSIVLV